MLGNCLFVWQKFFCTRFTFRKPHELFSILSVHQFYKIFNILKKKEFVRITLFIICYNNKESLFFKIQIEIETKMKSQPLTLPLLFFFLLPYHFFFSTFFFPLFNLPTHQNVLQPFYLNISFAFS